MLVALLGVLDLDEVSRGPIAILCIRVVRCLGSLALGYQIRRKGRLVWNTNHTSCRLLSVVLSGVLLTSVQCCLGRLEV